MWISCPSFTRNSRRRASFSHDHSHFIASFSSAADLVARTPVFWEKFVLAKLERDFLGIYRFLNDPYPDGPNYYLDRITANMERLRGKSEVRSPNFEVRMQPGG